MNFIPDVDNLPDLIQALNDALQENDREIKQIKSLSGKHKLEGDLDANNHRIINLSPVPLGQRDAITQDFTLEHPAEHSHRSKSSGGGLLHNRLINLIWSRAAHIIDSLVNHNSNPVSGISELRLDAGCKVYAGDTANNDFFFIIRPLISGNFIGIMC